MVRLPNGAAGRAAAEWRCGACGCRMALRGRAAAEWRCGGVRYSKKHDKVSPPRLSAHPRLGRLRRPGKGSCDAPT
jgi:hypothetical protein